MKPVASALALLFASLATPCKSSTELTTIYSDWSTFPESGDCGGHTLTLVRDDKQRVIRGYLQTYIGNCEDPKTPISGVQQDGEKHALAFLAPSYVQDGKGGLERAGEYRFSGTIAKNRVRGAIRYCPDDSKTCSAPEPIVLRAVSHETP